MIYSKLLSFYELPAHQAYRHQVNIHLHTTKYVVSLLLHSFPVHEDL
jgi:hypothetical protein